MNIGKIFDLIAKNNINPDDVFSLVEKIKTADLDDEATLRSIIKEASQISGRKVDPLQEDVIVKKIKRDGITEELLDEFK